MGPLNLCRSLCVKLFDNHFYSSLFCNHILLDIYLKNGLESLYQTNIYMLARIASKQHSLSFSLLPILSSITVFLSLKRAWGKREKREWFPGNPHRQKEPLSGWNYWREPRWCPWPEYRGKELCRWRSDGRWLRREERGRNIWFYFLFNSFCCFAFSFTAQCHALWLWGNYWTLWILGTKYWCLPTFKLFFF